MPLHNDARVCETARCRHQGLWVCSLSVFCNKPGDKPSQEPQECSLYGNVQPWACESTCGGHGWCVPVTWIKVIRYLSLWFECCVSCVGPHQLICLNHRHNRSASELQTCLFFVSLGLYGNVDKDSAVGDGYCMSESFKMIVVASAATSPPQPSTWIKPR